MKPNADPGLTTDSSRSNGARGAQNGAQAVSQTGAEQRANYWLMPTVRAVPTAALAVVITFSANHSALFGLISFGCFGILAGGCLVALAGLRLAKSGARLYFFAQAILSLLAGIAALTVGIGNIGSAAGQLRLLLVVLVVFSAGSGLLELYCGLRSSRQYVASADWITVGTLTLILAVALLLIPADFRHNFTGPDHLKRVLDSSVVVVGLLGAWAAVVTVFSVIAGLSARWGTETQHSQKTEAAPHGNPAPHQAESENRA